MFVFLSHRSTDKPRILGFVKRLEAARLAFWIDSPSAFGSDAPMAPGIEAGRDWPEQIDQALMKARAIVVFWSISWENGGAYLSMEHAVALSRHRAGTATYIPVLLDGQRALASQVQALRADRHDLVQAINIARDGERGWDQLFELLRQTLPKPLEHPDGKATARALDPSMKWAEILRAPPDDEKERARLLLTLPKGPPIDTFAVSLRIVQRIANATTALTAAGAVGEANALMMDSMAIRHDDRFAFIIMRGAVPDPNRIALQDYWMSVIEQACFLGPRMLAALLIALPASARFGSEDALGKVLDRVGITT
ncbi:toll/interleukin-1 receptor domain-containing protein [Sphingobium sp. TCM1]|uniref:toll/interleukin-1 receptor domain-containing protein n=1 Tax=Sphingobium sp. TCM1 TaxID=453246 RepID=UPI00082FD923